MIDSIFGQIEKDEFYFNGDFILEFAGTVYPVKLLIEFDDERITQKQYEAFQCFMKEWPVLQPKLIKALIDYYNQEERFSWGPDDEEELAIWWPEIETKEALLRAVTVESIVIPSEYLMEAKGGHTIYLLFSKAWGGEDLDDNGIGVAFLNEEIDEIAYKDIAF